MCSAPLFSIFGDYFAVLGMIRLLNSAVIERVLRPSTHSIILTYGIGEGLIQLRLAWLGSPLSVRTSRAMPSPTSLAHDSVRSVERPMIVEITGFCIVLVLEDLRIKWGIYQALRGLPAYSITHGLFPEIENIRIFHAALDFYPIPMPDCRRSDCADCVDLFTDGSCLHPKFADLRVSAGAVVLAQPGTQPKISVGWLGSGSAGRIQG